MEYHHPLVAALIDRQLTNLNKVVYEVGPAPEDQVVARHLAARFTGRGWDARAVGDHPLPFCVTFFGSMYRTEAKQA